MKKIMQINITCGVGSTGKLAEALYYAAETQGFESKFVYSAFSPSVPGAFRIENKFQNYLRRCENKYLGKQQKHSNPGTKRLIRFIEKEKPDLIHLHNIQHNIFSYPLLFDYLKKSNIPIVYTLHDCWAFTGGCYHFTLNHCDGYKNSCEKCEFKQPRDDVKRSAYDALLTKKNFFVKNKSICFVCVSEWLQNLAKQSFLKNAELTTIYNGIDTEIFRPTHVSKKDMFKTDTKYIVLGVAGYWAEKRKGGDTFLEIAKRIYPNGRVALIGEGAKKICQQYPEGMIGVDRIDDQRELANYYSAADVFVNASQEETFGLTTAEAMACGTPSIVYNGSACAEIVDSDTGILINNNNISDIVEAIYNVYNSNKDYKTLCRERAVRFFDTKVMEEAYIRLYRSII